MELSYEETMQRIAKYENDDLNKYIEGLKAYGFDYERTMYEIEKYEKKFKYPYCKEKKFPWSVDVFKGEHQLIVVPYITTITWLSTSMARYRILNENESPEVIGKAILDSFEHIRISPVDARTPAERKEDSYMKETKCKSYRAFNKKYICCGVKVENEQAEYRISVSINSFDNQGYCDIDGYESMTLPNAASSTDMGNAVINAFRIIEEYKKSQKPDPYPSIEIELLSDQKLEIFPPRDRHFTDMDDRGAGELYKVYEYYSNEGGEPSGVFYIGIAAELDCDISEKNIRAVWERLWGKPEEFSVRRRNGVFQKRVEMRNKSVHRISYLAKLDEDELLECTMEVEYPNRRKKLDQRLAEIFQEFVKNIKFL